MNWEELKSEGDVAVKKVCDGLEKRGINVGKSIMSQFGTDEDIPVYDSLGNKLFWISVKSVPGNTTDPKKLPPGYKGWMCGEVESKQWIYPPKIIIWYCLKSNVAWGAITPKRPSTEWFIYPDRYGIIKDQRKSYLSGEVYYIYPSYCVPVERIISKDQVIAYIKQLSSL
ncbi:MAG: hypothetical protein V7L14_21370 [Nostoc sp.]|uniref:hypothetical protein n=1 Tax=unclassified Nostoc TaxID=2593658 RepID=UPI0025F93393|nr:hypothetical protein [Nostoc sp. NOS(2021)]MBN3894223.1 hypothetical protein [Nostoc sp. NOS(2021)]